MKCFRPVISFFFSVVISVAMTSFVFAQTPDEHAKHHPKPQTTSAPDSSGAMTPNMGAKDSSSTKSAGMGGAKSGGMGGEKSGGMGGMMDGMMDGMGDMMKEMGKPPAKELYPSLMQLPDLSPEKREKIKQLADAQVVEGNALLNMGMSQLTAATRNQDMNAMKVATKQMRRGQILLESGLEGRQALAENKDPRLTALQWFNREMNLTPSVVKQPHGFFGLSWFHYITMGMFAAFAVLMVWMYFHKMKRANALVAKLSGNGSENTPLPSGATPVATAKSDVPPSPSKPATDTTNLADVNPDIAPSKSNAWTGTMLVAEIFDETPQVKTFRLTDPKGGKLPFNYLPGQFVTVTVVPNGVPVKRSYTIASSPTHRDYCEITVKHEEKGTVSHYMHTEVHIGELMQITAPSGKFTFTETHAKSAVFIGGGVGLTPMMSAIRYLTDRSWKGEIYFFFSCKDESSIIFRDELLYLEKRYPNLHVFFVLSQQQGEANVDFIPGHITKEIITERVPDIVSRMIHICGPKPMMDAVKLMMDELKVPKENVMQEVFAGPPPAAKTPPPATDAPVKPPNGKEAEQPATAEDGKPAAPEEGKGGVVTFAKSDKTAVLTPDKSVLEASEEVGVNIDYSCRVGTCGICKTKLISGKVTMAVQDALTEEDKAQNIILACQAKATELISVDA